MILESLDALRGHLRPAVAGLLLPTNSGGERAPTVVDGWLPPKERGQTEDEYPFVIVRPAEGSDTAADDGARSVLEVSIILGAYRDEPDGYRDVVSLLERVKLRLVESPYFGGQHGRRFRVEPPFAWSLPEEQPAPQWIAALRCSVTLPAALELNQFLEGAL